MWSQIGEHQPRPTKPSPFFLADLKAALPNTQASPTLLKLFMWRQKFSCTRCSRLVVVSMRLNFFGAVTCVAMKGTSLHLCNYTGAELFVDGRLNSWPSHPFMITAWCVKKTQQPSLERFPFSGHKKADEHTIFPTLHYLRPTPKAVRVKDHELTVALLPALVSKPSAQEALSVQSGARIVIVL